MSRVAGYQWTQVLGTAAGTTTVTASSAVLKKVYIPALLVGTVILYDSASGTSTKWITVPNETVDFPSMLDFNATFRNGIVAVKSAGTTDVTIVWDGG